MQSRKAKKDIKIRKSSKSKASGSLSHQNSIGFDREINILGNSDNQKILKIFEEIKKA
jgi:hypothetical protein